MRATASFPRPRPRHGLPRAQTVTVSREPDPGILPRVAIVGRPNVGKSTLFNRVVGRREAIVGSAAGMTRDRHLAEVDWTGERFVVVDTGGMEWSAEDRLPELVRRQALTAVEGSDLVLFLVDGREGLLPVEEEIGQLLRERGESVIVVVNKCDTPEQARLWTAEFHRLGIEPVIGVSAEHGRGVADLLDAVVERLPSPAAAVEPDEEATAVAVVGRPNVGKSSLVNALLGSERVVVSEVPGTTRDAVDSLVEVDDALYRLIDTAGIRKRGKLDSHVEIASVAVARRRMRRADVALLLIDPFDGVTRQDLHVAQEAEDAGCGLVIAVNKWDTVPPEEDLAERYRRYARQRLRRLSYAPITFISALRGTGVGGLLPLVDRVQASRSRRVPTAELNALFERLLQQDGGARSTALRPKYLTQVDVRPPTFVVFASGRRGSTESYRRYLENRLREEFDFSGSPVVIHLRMGGARRSRA